VGLSKLFPSGIYPEGELQPYKDEYAIFLVCSKSYILTVLSNAYRITSEEARYIETLAMSNPEETYNDIRRAAEVHRQVRRAARKFIRPGLTMTEIANFIEDGTRAVVEENGLECGVGFPTGLSLNNCAAHYTPNAGDTIGMFCYVL